MKTQQPPLEALFSGVIGKEYELLRLVCPASTKMSELVGAELGKNQSTTPLNVVELGGGTGITTLALLANCQEIQVLSIDSEPTMQVQAKTALAQWVNEGKLNFCGDDALTALKSLPSESVDVVATAYTLHNFLEDYRVEVIQEIFRVLKPQGRFINGDRYGLDDISEHTRLVQQEVSGYCKTFTELNRLDLLEHWVVHILSDESENHLMRETPALETLKQAGFSDIALNHRIDVSALVTAVKA